MAKIFCIERSVVESPFFENEVSYRYTKLVRDTETGKVSPYKLTRQAAMDIIDAYGMVRTVWHGTYRRWECPDAPYTVKS